MQWTALKQEQVTIFKKKLLEKNQEINLVSRKDPEKQIQFLFDQAFLTGKSLSSVFSSLKSPVLDIGSGNGFPGLCLGIFYPKNFFCLCERSRKKAEFLKYVLNSTKISNVKVECKTAEDIKDTFSVILSQAALPTARMLKLLERLLTPQGEAFLWKSSHWKKVWPEKTHFTAEAFASYQKKNSTSILLRLRKRLC